jgi:hypothetical protein
LGVKTCLADKVNGKLGNCQRVLQKGFGRLFPSTALAVKVYDALTVWT